jgi:hypothetical protein
MLLLPLTLCTLWLLYIFFTLIHSTQLLVTGKPETTTDLTGTSTRFQNDFKMNSTSYRVICPSHHQNSDAIVWHHKSVHTFPCIPRSRIYSLLSFIAWICWVIEVSRKITDQKYYSFTVLKTWILNIFYLYQYTYKLNLTIFSTICFFCLLQPLCRGSISICNC